MVMISIALLGSLQITQDGQPVVLPTRKAGHLLAYLALHADEAIPRTRLAGLLWPDSDNNRGNLRRELARLRQAFGGAAQLHTFLKADRESLTLLSDRVEIDVQRVYRLLESCEKHRYGSTSWCTHCCQRLSAAIDLYNTPLLGESPGIDSLEMADWLRFSQEELEKRILTALDSLLLYLAETGNHSQVIHYAGYQLSLCPWLETPVQRLMMAYTLSGARDKAIAAFENFRSYLQEKREEQPGPLLVQTYNQIRSYQITPQRLPTLASPYPGLAAFGLQEAHYFYGREPVVARLAEAVKRQPVVLFTGPSGSGKSSVIYAGLLPHLTAPAENGQECWSVISFRPGRTPLFNLAQALFPHWETGAARAAVADALINGNGALGQLVEKALPGPLAETEAGQRCLLVVDQFEELFTLCADDAERRLFLACLLEDVDKGSVRVSLSVLIALRADFMGQALNYRSFSAVSPDQIIFVGMMTDEQLRQAIEKPAYQNHVAYEPGLIERILADLDDSPGQLPLLQFALALLWEKRNGQWITHQAYNDIEEVSGALTHYANGIVARLQPTEQEWVRRIFLQLAHPGEGVEDSRRLASRSEIGEEQWPLVQKLASSRLVVTSQDRDGQETVEVVHEALIHQWGRLRHWLDEDRAFRLWQNRARLALRLWQREGEHPDALLRGLALAEAERWLLERSGDVDPALTEFVQTALQARSVRLADEQRRNRELEQALNESRRQERRALARQLGAQADQLLQRKVDLALLLSVEALRRADQPQDRTDILTMLEINPYLQKILHGHQSPLFYVALSADGQGLISADERNNVQIWQMDNFSHKPLFLEESAIADDVALDPTGHFLATVHGRQIALWETATLRSRLLLPSHHAPIFRLRFSVDGKFLLSIAEDGNLCLWETTSGTEAGVMPPLSAASSLQVGPEAALLAVAETSDRGPAIRLRDRQSGAALGPHLLGHREQIHGIALSRDGCRLATASFDGSVRLWDTKNGVEYTPPLTAHRGRVLFAAFSPDGRWLATGGTDNRVYLWDAHTGQPLGIAPFVHSNWVRCALFSEDNRLLVSGDSDGKLYIWELARHTLLAGHTKRVRSVAVSPDGGCLATFSVDGCVRLWDTESLQCRRCLTGKEGAGLLMGSFSPDGKTLAALDAQGRLLLWETATWQPRHISFNPHNEPSIALAFSPDSRWLAQGDLNGYVSVWDAQRGELAYPPTQLHRGPTSWILSLAFSPDGKTLATGGKDRTIGFWSVEGLRPAAPRIHAHENWVTHVLYTGDGRTLISSSADGSVRFWDTGTGQACAPPLTGHPGQVWQAAFCPVKGEKVLVALVSDGTLFQWDLESWTPLNPPLRTGRETETMALSPDGRRVYLGSFDANAHAWDLPQQPWVERVCQIANRSLSREEWSFYLGDTA